MKSISFEEFKKMLEEDNSSNGEEFMQKVLDKAKEKEDGTMEILVKKLYDLPPRCREAKIEAFLELIKIHKTICVECELKQGIKKVEW